VIRDCLERTPAIRTQPLKAGELELDRDARRAGGLDQRASLLDERNRKPLGRRPLGRRGGQRLGPQSGGIRVQSQNELRRSCLYPLVQLVGEVTQI
jgi:hypothetical protein